MMVYAQIMDGVIVNEIIVNEESDLSTLGEGFDYFLRIDDLSPMPSIGWLYDGSNFTPVVRED